MAEPLEKPYLICDTNIIQTIGSKPKEKSDKVLEIIQEYERKNYQAAISNITFYEAIQRCDEKKEAEVILKLDLLTQLETSQEVLRLAAWLADLYRLKGVPDSQISDCDKFIAATAYLTKSLIISADANDFPRPFFNEIEKRVIYYLDLKKRNSLMIVYIFEPDIIVLNSMLINIHKIIPEP